MPALVTLTTDFGTCDPYVAELKGVLYSEGPADLRVVDLSHELRAFDIAGAALFVRSAIPRFPHGTIHVVVVDPGVGSDRKAIVVRAQGQLLVGPDNRSFGYLFGGDEEVFEIHPSVLGQRAVSSTFHGRDVFAPAAALLARGAAPETLGERITAYQHLVFPLVEYAGETLSGRVIHVDRYGNLVTNISRTALADFLAEPPAQAVVYVGERRVGGILRSYSDAKPAELLALLGSSDLLEVAQREGSAADKLSAHVGKAVRVQRA